MASTIRARPDPIPLVDGVWLIPGARGANVYAIRRPDGTGLLVDAGLPGSADVIAGTVREVGIERVTHILLTHRHPDHAGSAAELRERLGAAVVLGAGDVSGGFARTEGRRGPVRRRLRRFEPVPVDVALPPEEHEPVPGLLAIPAPGHTAGSTVYVLLDRDLWFIGDAALHSGDRMSRPLPVSNEDTEAQERSLAAIANRAGANGAPGHGDPIIGGFGELMRALASRPPAPGPWWLRVVLNPRAMWRFMQRQRGG